MANLFKIITAPTPAKPTIGDTTFKDFYPKVNTNTVLKNFEPYINDALDLYILPFISEAFYDALLVKRDNNTLSTQEAKALTLLYKAAAYYAVMYAYPKEQDIFAEVGIAQNNAEKTINTPAFTFKSKLWDLTITADRHMDALLKYLEARVKANDTNFNTFKNSDEYKNGKADLFKASWEFQNFHNINESRRTYLALLPALRDASILHITPEIGGGIYNELKTQYHANTLTSANAVILPMLQAVAAKFALVVAADTEGVLFDNNYTVRVVSNPDGMDMREAQITARMKARQSAKIVHEGTAKQYLKVLKDFLNANADDYPTYKTEMIDPDDNRTRNKIVVSEDASGNVTGAIGLF